MSSILKGAKAGDTITYSDEGEIRTAKLIRNPAEDGGTVMEGYNEVFVPVQFIIKVSNEQRGGRRTRRTKKTRRTRRNNRR